MKDTINTNNHFNKEDFYLNKLITFNAMKKIKKGALTCILPILLFLMTTSLIAQQVMPMPTNGRRSSSRNTYGFWFVAPTNFTITALRMPKTAGTNTQYIQVVKMLGTNGNFNFTPLDYIKGAANGVIQNVSIPVQAGDKIGILGCIQATGFSSPTFFLPPRDNYTSKIGTHTFPIMQLLASSRITFSAATAGQGGLTGTAGYISTIEVQYEIPPPADDAGISAILSPSLPTCDLKAKDIKVELTNHGTNTLKNTDIHWSINGVAQPSKAWTGSLANKATATVSLGTSNFNTGDILTTWTELPNGITDQATYNDSSEVKLFTSMHGNYTIGATNSDYTSFTDAVNDLNTLGVCDAAVFHVRPGTYTEHIQIDELFGQAANRPVSFVGDTGTNRPLLRTIAGTNTVTLNNVSNITFRNIEISNLSTSNSTAISLKEDVSNTTFDSCYISNTSTNSSVIEGNSIKGNNIVFTNNTIENGSNSFTMQGATTSSPTGQITIANNKVINPNYRGLKFQNIAKLTITHNDISSNSKLLNGEGIYLYYTNNTTISYNKIYCNDTANSAWPSTGIETFEVGYAVYNGNIAAITNGNNIYNNFIQVGNRKQSSQNYGLNLFRPDVSNSYYNNNINVLGTNVNSYGIYIRNITSRGEAIIYNNNVKIQSGTAYQSNGAATADYNNYYSVGGDPLFSIDGKMYFDIDALHADTLQVNSISEDPFYASYKNLYSCNIDLKGTGTYYNNLNNYIDDIARDSLAPDMGATIIAFDPVGVLGSDTLICPGDTIQLGYKNTKGTFKWNTGDSTSALIVTSPGTYTLEAKTVCGQDSASIKIFTGIVTLRTDTFLCPGDSIVLGTPNVPGIHVWLNISETTSMITATKPDEYVLYSNNACEQKFDTVLIADAAINASFTDSVDERTVYFKADAGYQYSYSWDFGDNKSSTTQNPTHTYSGDGNYNVVLKITNVCGTDQNNRMITIEKPTGIAELSAEQLIVKPNPSNGNFTLQLNDMAGEGTSIHIFDIRGRQVYNSNFVPSSNTYRKQISLDNAQSGVYILKIQTGNKFHEQKIIVVK